MSHPNASFEIQVLADKNWVVLELASDETQAKAFADNLLQKGNHSAVRVVRDIRRLDGTHSETIIQEKTAQPRSQGADLALGVIQDAPLCQDLADFLGLDARLTLGRLLRKYLDETQITPSELLHNAAEMKRFGDKGSLLFSAIDRVSTLQAPLLGCTSRERRDHLAQVWDQMVARAKAFAAAKPSPPAHVAAIMAAGPGGPDGDYAALSLISLRLVEIRAWTGKLDLILTWAQDPEAAALLPLLDGIVADCLCSAQLIQDLLGYQANLGAALCTIADLVEGAAQAPKFAPDIFSRLNQAFARGWLVQSAQVLMGRLTRELAGQSPLSRNEPKQESEVYHRVLHRLVRHRGVLGGGVAAESLLHRMIRQRSPDLGNVSAEQGVNLVQQALDDATLKVQFLVALAESDAGQALGGRLVALLVERVQRTTGMDGWVPARLAPPERMAAMAAANRCLLRSSRLDKGLCGQLAQKLDEALAEYLLREEVIEKIDKPADPLALRAIRLVKFCGSGVLIEGKSLNLARARIIEHLRQPQFEEKFLASVPEPAKAERHLREFHRLLVETGFR